MAKKDNQDPKSSATKKAGARRRDKPAKPGAPPAVAPAAADPADWIDAAFASPSEARDAGLPPNVLPVKPQSGCRSDAVIPLESFIGTDRNWFSATFELAPISDPAKRHEQIAALRLAMAAFLRAYPEVVRLVASAQSCPPAQASRARQAGAEDPDKTDKPESGKS